MTRRQQQRTLRAPLVARGDGSNACCADLGSAWWQRRKTIASAVRNVYQRELCSTHAPLVYGGGPERAHSGEGAPSRRASVWSRLRG
jgi:hypothetical protein